MAKKELEEVKDKSLMTGIDFSADAGAGMEGTDKESFAIPFLRVIQSNSPQVTRNDALYMEAAKPGMLLNTVTNELIDGDEGTIFLPSSFQRRFVRWAPRGDSAGYKGEMLPEDFAVQRGSADLPITELDGKLYVTAEPVPDPKKHDQMVDTRNHFGILISDAGASQVLLSLSSSQIKKSKQLMSLLSAVKVETPKGLQTPPTWMNKIRIKTVPESNDQGSWFGVKVESEGFITDAGLYAMGKDFHETVAAGEARVNYNESSEAKETDGKF